MAIPQTRLPLAVLAELDISASAIASAPLPHFRWELLNRKQETEVPIQTFATALIFLDSKKVLHHTNSTQNKRARACRRANLDEMTTNFYPACYNSLDRLSVSYAINAINKDQATRLLQTDEGQKQLSPENRAVAVT